MDQSSYKSKMAFICLFLDVRFHIVLQVKPAGNSQIHFLFINLGQLLVCYFNIYKMVGSVEIFS